MNSDVNFSQINVVMCTVGDSRMMHWYSSIFNLLMNAKNIRINVAYNSLEMSPEALDAHMMLANLAKVTGNRLNWHQFSEDYSKAQMIAALLSAELYKQAMSRQWMLNVDDDYMIPYKTLKLLELAATNGSAQHFRGASPQTNTYVYGQFDVINKREYQDWDATPLKISDLFNFARDNGLRCMPNHLAAEIPNELITFKMPGQSTGAYMMRMTAITHEMGKVLLEWPKGKRGYDEFLCNAVGNVEWIWGSNSFHTDATGAHVDGKIWKEDVFRDDLMLDGTVTGRLPSQEGGMSIPRGAKPADAPTIPNLKDEK